MRNKIWLKTIFVICLIVSLFFSLSFKSSALSIVEENEMLKNIEEIANDTIASEIPIVNGENVNDIMADSDAFFVYLNNKDIAKSENIETAVSKMEIGNEEIAKKVKEYQEEQKRLEIKRQMNSRGGMVGRLIIPDVDLDVAVIRASIYNGSHNQAVVDARDSAAWMYDWGAAVLIGDHNNQGFEKMKGAIPNVTKCYINNGDTIKTYICIKNIQGHNTGSSITDANYRSLSGDNAGGLIMYTCNENWRNITITYWKPI